MRQSQAAFLYPGKDFNARVIMKLIYQIMPGAQWLELLCQHVPDQDEYLVRYDGWYSNRSRDMRR